MVVCGVDFEPWHSPVDNGRARVACAEGDSDIAVLTGELQLGEGDSDTAGRAEGSGDVVCRLEELDEGSGDVVCRLEELDGDAGIGPRKCSVGPSRCVYCGEGDASSVFKVMARGCWRSAGGVYFQFGLQAASYQSGGGHTISSIDNPEHRMYFFRGLRRAEVGQCKWVVFPHQGRGGLQIDCGGTTSAQKGLHTQQQT